MLRYCIHPVALAILKQAMPSFPLPPDPNQPQPVSPPSAAPEPVAPPSPQPQTPSVPPPPADFSLPPSSSIQPPPLPPGSASPPPSPSDPGTSLPPFPPAAPASSSPQSSESSTSVGPESSTPAIPDTTSLPGDTLYVAPREDAPPSLPPDTTGTPSPAAALPPKSSPFKYLLPILGVLAVIGVVAYLAFRFLNGSSLLPGSTKKTAEKTPEPVTITYYGLWESEAVMRQVLSGFESANPGIKVRYQMESPVDYRERLQNTLGKPGSPDVIRFHSTWLPMLLSLLQPAPATLLPSAEIQSNFYPAVASSVIVAGQVYAVPTTIEGLALFANEDMLSTIQATTPVTWEELRDTADSLVKYDRNTRQITQAGVALGTTANVSHWPDIVSLMMLQNNADMTKPDAVHAGEALEYYVSFASGDTRVWDDTLPDSIQAFAAGKVAFIFAPSWRALDIQALNPSLRWKVYPVPQLRGEDDPVTWANFWVEGVSKTSAHPEEAWKLVKYLASSQAQQALFTAASSARGFGQPPANKALAQQVSVHPIVGPFVTQAATAKTFYTTSLTHDGPTGINSRIIKYLENAVNALGEGTSLDVVVPPLEQGFYQILSEYNLVAPTPYTTP